MTDRTVEFLLLARDRASGPLNSVGASADRTAGRMAGLQENFGKLAAGAAVVAGAMAVVGRVMQDSVAQGLAKANARVALGTEAYAALSAQADRTANKMGMTTTEFIKTGGQVAILARNLGFSTDEASKFGGQLPVVADQLAMLSAGNLSAAEASDVLRSALAGEYDPLQAVGIAISAEIVAQEKANILKVRGAELTDLQAGALATMNIVQRQTSLATQVATTAEGQHAIAIEESKAKMKEMYETLSGKLLPVMGELAQTATDSMNETSAAVDEHSVKSVASIGKWFSPMYWLDHSLGNVKEKSEAAGQAQAGMGGATMTAAQQAQAAAARQDQLTAAINRQLDATQRQVNLLLGSRGAQRDYQAAIDAASAALAENGQTLNINTEKGRQNQAALDLIAQSANAQAEALRKSGASTDKLSSLMDESRTQLIKSATQFGMTKKQAEAYAAQVLAIPPVVTTTARLDTEQANAQIAALRSKLFSLRGLTADPLAGTAGRGLGVYKRPSSVLKSNSPVTVGVPAMATGGIVTKPTLAIIGEAGAEAVVPLSKLGTMLGAKAGKAPAPTALGGGVLDGLQGQFGAVSSRWGTILERFVDQIAKVKVSEKIKGTVSHLVNAIGDSLGKQKAALDKVREKIDDARKSVEDLVKARSDYAQQLSSGVNRGLTSIQLAEDITDPDGNVTKVDKVKAFIDSLQKRSDSITAFQANLDTLGKNGASQDTLQQLAAAGVETGGALAAALAQGSPEAIAQIEALNNQIGIKSKTFGDRWAGDMYDNGIRAAEGVLKGLESYEGRLLAYVDVLGNKLKAQLATIISGPAATAMPSTARPAVTTPSKPANTAIITINAGMLTSAADVARALERTIQEAGRQGVKVNLAVN